jgi:peptide chain release factor 1
MHDRLERLKARFTEIDTEIQNPDIVRDAARYREAMREHAYLSKLMEEYANYRRIESDRTGAQEIARAESDPELREMAKEEAKELDLKLAESEARLKVLLIPPDPLEEKNIIMEIRGGTGGDEAALFAADLFRMYTRFAESKGWRYEVLSSNETELGGFKEITFSISGKYVYGSLRYESGVHRVQRVPATEASGRIHTSAVTVAVLPEAEETEIVIRQEDLRVDVMRAGGPGGGSASTPPTRPCGLPISRPPRGDLPGREKPDQEQSEGDARPPHPPLRDGRGEEERRARGEPQEPGWLGRPLGAHPHLQLPQNRLTDHRINLTLYKLDWSCRATSASSSTRCA